MNKRQKNKSVVKNIKIKPKIDEKKLFLCLQKTLKNFFAEKKRRKAYLIDTQF